jgi:hypothetical protein
VSKLAEATPTFLGGLFGAVLVADPEPRFGIALGGLAAASVISLVLGRAVFPHRPRVGAWLMEGWALFLPAITALLVWIFLWATIRWEPTKGALRLGDWSKGQTGELVKFVAGLIAGFVGILATDGAEAGDNPLRTARQFKRAALAASPARAADNETRYYAAQMESTRLNEVSGWGFHARRVRARLLAGP